MVLTILLRLVATHVLGDGAPVAEAVLENALEQAHLLVCQPILDEQRPTGRCCVNHAHLLRGPFRAIDEMAVGVAVGAQAELGALRVFVAEVSLATHVAPAERAVEPAEHGRLRHALAPLRVVRGHRRGNKNSCLVPMVTHVPTHTQDILSHSVCVGVGASALQCVEHRFGNLPVSKFAGHLLSVPPAPAHSMAEKATASDRPPSPGTLSIVRTRSRVALCDDIRLLERARAARASEVASIADLKGSLATHDECPVWLSAYAEQRFCRARGLMMVLVLSSTGYDCSLRLLMSVGQYRAHCAEQTVSRGVIWAPGFREQMALPAAISARGGGGRRSAPAAIRRAAMTAQQQIAALMRLMDGDADFERVREAVREASEVAVQVHGAEEGAEGQEAYFDGAWVRRGIGTGLTSDELHRQLQEEMAAEAALEAAPPAASSGLETAEGTTTTTTTTTEGALQAEAARPRMEASAAVATPTLARRRQTPRGSRRRRRFRWPRRTRNGRRSTAARP